MSMLLSTKVTNHLFLLGWTPNMTMNQIKNFGSFVRVWRICGVIFFFFSFVVKTQLSQSNELVAKEPN